MTHDPMKAWEEATTLIRRLCEEDDLKLQDIAELLGVSRTFLASYMRYPARAKNTALSEQILSLRTLKE